MTVQELSRDQLIALKQAYLCETEGAVYWSQLADADEQVPDETVFREYAGTVFGKDDFA